MVRVHLRPLESLDMPIERFFASLRLEGRSKLDHLVIEIGSFEKNQLILVRVQYLILGSISNNEFESP